MTKSLVFIICFLFFMTPGMKLLMAQERYCIIEKPFPKCTKDACVAQCTKTYGKGSYGECKKPELCHCRFTCAVPPPMKDEDGMNRDVHPIPSIPKKNGYV
ncbi:S locus-related glycoprotein 1 binding pollen coat [Cynara cardunculus var. scolymus]|uniref:S locus-related glycoprotein 1 binding pollen coat n=1 Tax=Cynara cardunculus var. scolymus TaxID=59895 RepID=A0A103XZK4_CYNCS|nr:S locus-related glycoprotein 1 binding pollen coat [Cynara cardunculus var. scolymus]